MTLTVVFGIQTRLAFVLATAILFASPGAAMAGAGSSGTGTSCAANAPSAVNQYCEDIPGATGGHQLGPGDVGLASVLPPAVRRALAASTTGPTRQGLLGLPAPKSHARLKSAATRQTGTSEIAGGGWSLFGGLLLVLGVIALLAIATMTAKRLRRTAPA